MLPELNENPPVGGVNALLPPNMLVFVVCAGGKEALCEPKAGVELDCAGAPKLKPFDVGLWANVLLFVVGALLVGDAAKGFPRD